VREGPDSPDARALAVARRSLRSAWAPIACALPLRLLLAAGTELSPDEAYYVGAARLDGWLPRLPDHPPVVVWLSALGDALPIPSLALRVRLPFVALSVALTLASVAAADRAGAGARGRRLVALATTLGLLPTVGGFLATPDVAALLAVVLGLAWATGPSPVVPFGPTKSLAVGVALALGALAKVVVAPLAVVVALASRRGWHARVAVLMPLAFASPLLAASLRFQTAHAYASAAPGLVARLAALAGAVGVQLALWSPWLLLRGAAAARRAPTSPAAAIALATSAMVALSSLARGLPPEPNWWAPGALALIVLAGATTPEPTRKQAAIRPRDLADRALPAIVAWLAVPTLVASAHALHPFLPLPRAADPTARLHGWNTDHPPLDAPGVGPYALAAERCASRDECMDLSFYFEQLRHNR
jgi:hypothetical protein